jgi:hypothetical protein
VGPRSFLDAVEKSLAPAGIKETPKKIKNLDQRYKNGKHYEKHNHIKLKLQS